MTLAFTLVLASAIIGMATGRFLRVWALIVICPLIAILAAIVLQGAGFGFVGGVTIIAGCLLANQASYLAATFRAYDGELSVQDEADGHPGKHGEQNIRDENE